VQPVLACHAVACPPSTVVPMARGRASRPCSQPNRTAAVVSARSYPASNPGRVSPHSTCPSHVYLWTRPEHQELYAVGCRTLPYNTPTPLASVTLSRPGRSQDLGVVMRSRSPQCPTHPTVCLHHHPHAHCNRHWEPKTPRLCRRRLHSVQQVLWQKEQANPRRV
jgi:hypothetical protein